MKYYIKSYKGQIYQGKANTWDEVWRGMSYGDKLYNPYTGQTVIGWNRYKQIMANHQNKAYKNRY